MRPASLIKGIPELTLLVPYVVLNLEEVQSVDCQDDERQFVVDFEVIGPIIIIIIIIFLKYIQTGISYIAICIFFLVYPVFPTTIPDFM
jgi:hypothetical protein